MIAQGASPGKNVGTKSVLSPGGATEALSDAGSKSYAAAVAPAGLGEKGCSGPTVGIPGFAPRATIGRPSGTNNDTTPQSIKSLFDLRMPRAP